MSRAASAKTKTSTARQSKVDASDTFDLSRFRICRAGGCVHVVMFGPQVSYIPCGHLYDYRTNIEAGDIVPAGSVCPACKAAVEKL